MNGKSGVRELGSPLGESERSGGAPNGAAATRREPSAAVPEKPKRRSFTPEYKVRIVEEADACTQPGEIGALLRREGLYSSHLVGWRREYRTGAVEGLRNVSTVLRHFPLGFSELAGRLHWGVASAPRPHVCVSVPRSRWYQLA